MQYSLWLLNLDNTPQQVIEHFKGFVDSNDRLWISTVRNGEHWFTNAMSDTNKWLEDNPPA